MKKIFGLLFAGVTCVLIISSCSKSSSGTSMTATIGGSSFSASTCIFGGSTSGVIITGQNISGTNISYPQIVITLANYTTGTTGTIAINSVGTSTTTTTPIAEAVIDSSASSTSTGGTAAFYGTVNITSSSSSAISGTFSFTTLDSTKVTNGAFSAKL